MGARCPAPAARKRTSASPRRMCRPSGRKRPAGHSCGGRRTPSRREPQICRAPRSCSQGPEAFARLARRSSCSQPRSGLDRPDRYRSRITRRCRRAEPVEGPDRPPVEERQITCDPSQRFPSTSPAPATRTGFGCNQSSGSGHSVVVTPDEPDAVARVYEAYSAQVYAYALRRSDRDTADEVTARVFLVASRRRRSLPADPLPWLYGVARRVLAEERRSQRRRRGLHGRLRSMTVEDTTELTLPDQSLARALHALSATDREVLLLCYWEGLDHAQIARVMGCTRAAAGVRLHRARGRLRRALESEGHERACAVGADS